ncbi:hypothetical protein GIW70_19110 [Pseudomonas syringae]|nr:hypothetical protein [Pseudomonas syringae]MCF5070302.1 hypothetical protein [Pseudomonas syringae]
MSEEINPPGMGDWQRAFDDKTLWQQSPDAHYLELKRIANDMLGQGAIDLEQWQILEEKIEQAHQDSPGVNVAREVADPEA